MLPSMLLSLLRRIPPRSRRRVGLALGAALLLGFLSLGGVSQWVRFSVRRQVYGASDVPARPVAIVFGAGIHPGGDLSAVLEDRMRTAVELYRAGKVRKLLLSGDNRWRYHNEPLAMRRFALEHGVPAADIVLDFAGFRSYDTCYRARAVFAVRGAILVTQSYHLPRVLYTARHLGIDAVGVAADRRRYERALYYGLREQLSRVVAFFELHVTRPGPRFLGPQLPIVAVRATMTG